MFNHHNSRSYNAIPYISTPRITASIELLAGPDAHHPSFHLEHQFRLNPQRSLGEYAAELLKKRSVAEQEPGQRPLRPAALVVHQVDLLHPAPEARRDRRRRLVVEGVTLVVVKTVRVSELPLRAAAEVSERLRRRCFEDQSQGLEVRGLPEDCAHRRDGVGVFQYTSVQLEVAEPT